MRTIIQRGKLPRLARDWYCGLAAIFWTHTVEGRGRGWLGPTFHAAFREHMLHAATRENLLCPAYTLMPDHAHLIWLSISEDSDQQSASSFVRTRLGRFLAPWEWQSQPHDHVLRAEERSRDALAGTGAYICANPVRARLVERPEDWPYTGCIVPGYPDLHPLKSDFPEKFWRYHNAAIERGTLGKM